MKEFTFPAWCNYGTGDSGESWIDVELTDEEAVRLVKFGTQSEIYYNEFYNCKELQDIYDKAYTIAVKQMTAELREWGDWLDESKRNNPDWKIDDTYPCGVEFPQEFEDMLPDEE